MKKLLAIFAIACLTTSLFAANIFKDTDQIFGAGVGYSYHLFNFDNETVEFSNPTLSLHLEKPVKIIRNLSSFGEFSVSIPMEIEDTEELVNYGSSNNRHNNYYNNNHHNTNYYYYDDSSDDRYMINDILLGLKYSENFTKNTSLFVSLGASVNLTSYTIDNRDSSYINIGRFIGGGTSFKMDKSLSVNLQVVYLYYDYSLQFSDLNYYRFSQLSENIEGSHILGNLSFTFRI